MYEKSLVYKITKILIEILFYLGIACIICIPFIADLLKKYALLKEGFYMPFCFILLITGVSCEYILFILRKMYKSLLNGNPFSAENVTAFRKLGLACCVSAIVFFIKLIFAPTFATLVITLIFVIGTLFCLTLKEVFKQAVYYKEENDLTI